MATEVVMPQMGESIAEGTITKWMKNVGDHVDRDEPLFEISTDKVDAEIPSPAAGTLTEIRFKEGETVEVNTVVAMLDGDGAQPAAKPEASPPVRESALGKTESSPPESAKAEAPAAGEGISASTLSVEISNKGSSRSTWSPTFFNHLVMVPSAMDSPICGITTSVAMITSIKSV